MTVWCWRIAAQAPGYAASDLSGTGPIPFSRYLVRIDIPEPLWRAAVRLQPLPGGSDAIPAGASARAAGDAWIAACASALLPVLSVMVPDKCNVLINPQHAGAAAIAAVCVRRWMFDPRRFA